MNTTIETLIGDSGFWRHSLSTKEFYKCKNKALCLGTSCAEGYDGVLCEVCVDKNKYFDYLDGKCADCPYFSRLAIVAGILAGSAVVIFLVNAVRQSFPDFDYCLGKFSYLFTRISLQAKLKVTISFYQIVTTLKPIYGVSMHSTFASWFRFIQYFNLGLAEWLGIPISCFGSMKDQLSTSALWPYAFILLLVCVICMFTFLVDMRKSSTNDIVAKILARSLHATIITFYLVLLPVSRNIFDALRCKSFATNDLDGLSTSYLIADWTLKCDKGDAEYGDVKKNFWVFFAVWPVAVPLVSFCLLLRIRVSVQSKCITPLAEACRFLWSDYESSMMLWEFIDMARKICLIGLIIFIDPEQGLERVLRLLVAIIICVVYVIIVSLARPYKRNDDLYLSVISNLLLTCCFVVGIMIHQCKEEDDWDEESNSCERIFGLSLNSYQATLVAVFMTAATLIVFTLSIIVLTVNAMNEPTICLVSTNRTPNLDMSAGFKNHIFFSYVRKAENDKGHKIVQILQLFLPEVDICFDVDALKNISLLEESVAKAAHFVLFYSKGYFESFNCRREVTEAISREKSITVVYETDDNLQDEGFIDEMKEECRQHFPLGSIDIFAKDPVLWVNSSQLFSVESVKTIAMRLLRNLPYYKKRPSLLNAGLKTSCDRGPAGFLEPLQIIYCGTNRGVRDIALKLKEECTGNVSTYDISLSSSQVQYDNKKSVMLLYLNTSAFLDADDLTCECVKQTIDANIPLILIHEMDTDEGGCSFDYIMMQTPQVLMGGCYKLYSENIAVPLYSMKRYQQVSLRQILKKMGARPTGTPGTIGFLICLHIKRFFSFQRNNNQD